MDKHDVLGAVGFVAVTAAIQQLAGAPWALLFVGLGLLGLYALRELAPLLGRRRGGPE